MRRYVHYGAPSYDPELFQAVNNGGYHNKPKGGLWLSAVDAEKGWEKWCLQLLPISAPSEIFMLTRPTRCGIMNT